MPPLSPGPRDPHHALEVGPVMLRRATATTAFRRQQRLD
ncbi:hypothetical protein CP97_14712 [Aurantiacibacter atlanticus]|uniref:Uncharacterized protein n=1 Tax=Aurantiacibacter atlanticus TaxID=1648404 RepID=A0A0H4VD49_9SPHN|nr:hypothetical protein CP97_09900 [Aurantiacibacter atlanticus]ANC50333.1 hypothetical protein CP97_14647 [Aurantiacibacter atlanticus]ANC50354.1 hypothetical protein CP97_14668 [Aurantiacibacter atlanticus]ANC50398.1 hypothetical protein CP97_14712 [Aurantiacibacter atlanticus]